MSSRVKAILFKIFGLVALVTPMLVLFCLRAKTWFIQKSGVEVSIGAIMAMIVSFCMLKGYLKKVNKIIVALILTIISYLLSSIVTDLYMIFGMATLGFCLSYPFEILDQRYSHIADIVRDEYVKTYARDKALEEIRKKEGE